MGLWRVRQDLGRIFRGIGAFLHYLLSRQDLDVAIGLLSAGSSIARRGEPNQYVVRIANASRARRDLVLTIDLTVANIPERSKGRYAYLTKSLSLQPCASSTIAVQYDWIGHASFQINGNSTPPEDSWRGTIDAPRLYAVTALLCDTRGRQLDELTVYQELSA